MKTRRSAAAATLIARRLAAGTSRFQVRDNCVADRIAWERIMQKRTLLAVSTLTALLLSVGTLQPAPMETGAELALHSHQVAPHVLPSVEEPVAPQWAYAWGMGGNESLVFGILGAATCAPFLWIGSLACGITGAF